MASQRRSRGKPQASTHLTSRSGNVSYHRQGGTRMVKAGSYRGGRTTGGYYTVAAPSGQQVSARAPERAYHRFILAEYLACVAMVTASMILLPAQDAQQGTATAARSFAKELVQLTALSLVFFVLALAAGGPKTGKVSAAFGGLVTLGVAWNLSQIFGALAKTLTGAGNPKVSGILNGLGGNGPASTGVGEFSTPIATPIGAGT